MPVKEAGAVEDLLRYKLETIAMYDRMLKNTFSTKFAEKFIADPKGAYETASPEQKKVIDFIMDHIPAKRSKADDEKDRKVSKKHESLWKKIDKATKDLKKKQVTPSEKPTQSWSSREGIHGVINAGL